MHESLTRLKRFVSAVSNRGFLLDLFVFVLNISVMMWLTRGFQQVIREANAGHPWAAQLLFGMVVSLFVLAPIGATLSRWHYHQSREANKATDEPEEIGGCLFNPILYFCLTAIIFSTVYAAIVQAVYGRKEPGGNVFFLSILGGIILMIVHTWLVYRYFSTPTRPPRLTFLRSRASGVIGQVLLFANMVLFQLVWNLLSSFDAPPPKTAVEFLGRLFLLLFVALLLYFPPRMFTLVDDIGKRRTWFMILLANSPIIARMLFGWGIGQRW